MNQIRNRMANAAVPMAAALCLAAAATVSAAVGTPTAPPERANADGAPQSPAVLATTGDPDDPATWRLPIEAYMPTTAQARITTSTRDDLLDTCMAGAGYPDWRPAPDLPPIGGKTLTDWRYGIHDAALAAERGYHPDAQEQKEYDAAIEIGAVDSSGADEATMKRCVSQVDSEVPATASAELVQQISGQSFLQSQNEPDVVDVFADWSSCMEGKGFDYAEPMDANDDPAFADPNIVTDKEIATAKADIECRDKYQVERTWFDAEAKLQQAAITVHQEELDQVVANTENAVSKASDMARQ
ncbi:hypothetical protein ACIQ6Y_31970 [Streptomyces sp. NPDC096205]|uniref:hypothetical protein n=1 Tax=Streptomyces sp. NPDC096205 TaxID=3366081 RepID=UPI0037F6E555